MPQDLAKEIEKIICPDNRSDTCLDHRDCEALATEIAGRIEKMCKNCKEEKLQAVAKHFHLHNKAQTKKAGMK